MDVWTTVFLAAMLLFVYLVIVTVTMNIDAKYSHREPSGKRALVVLLVIVTGGVASLALIYFAYLAERDMLRVLILLITSYVLACLVVPRLLRMVFRKM